MPTRKPDDLPPGQGEFMAAMLRTLTRGYGDWILSAIVALFIAFLVGTLRWAYDGVRLGPGGDFLSLLGLWLVCYWAVALVSKAFGRG